MLIRPELPTDVPAREHLLDRCFGPDRFRKTCERLREGRRPAEGLAFAAIGPDGLVGTVRLWSVVAGAGRPALLLGPIAVAPEGQGAGLGSALMRTALGAAASRGHGAVLLVGDPAYYCRFGFERALAEGLALPGPFEPERFVGLELRPGALRGAAGCLVATGAPDRAERDRDRWEVTAVAA